MQAGYSSGQSIKAIQESLEKLYLEVLLTGLEFQKLSRSETRAIFIFLICLLFVHLVLAAQYGFILPLQ
jgi:multidrug efflux pump subunit AcrB